jgi:hypothetical protein
VQRPSRIVLLFAAVLAVMPIEAQADPIRIIEGSIQVSVTMTDFNFQTSEHMFTGELETGQVPPVLLSGMPGDVLNLSTVLSGELSNFSVDNVNLDPTSFDFRFTGGPVTVPDIHFPTPDGESGEVFAPFTFTGSLLIPPGDGAPAQQFALTGSGRARSLFRLQFQDGEPLINAPRVSYSVIYDFALSEPIPEPASVLLVGTGLLIAAARLWRQRKA